MGGNRRSEDHGDVPWPALVDLLTSVLITFMFFILVTTVAMSTMTMKAAKDAQQKKKETEPAAEEAQPEAPVEDMVSSTLLPPPPQMAPAVEEKMLVQLEALKQENEILKKQLAATTINAFRKSKEIRVESHEADNKMVLFFNPSEAGMTPETEQKVRAFISKVKAQNPAARIELVAAQPQTLGVARGRELGLSRALVVRNVLLDQQVPAAHIRVQYQQGNQILEQSQDWLMIRITTAGSRP